MPSLKLKSSVAQILQIVRGLNSSVLWAGGIAAVIGLWILSGELFGIEPPKESALDDAANLPKVRATVSFAQPFVNEIVVRGRTEAFRVVTVKAETTGQVVAVPVAEGSLVAEGDVLCELSLDAREAQRTEAEATVEQRRLEYDAARQLLEQGHRSETQAAAALAAFDAALAALESIKLDLERTKIRAPFAAVLDDRPVEVGDYVRAGDACGTLVDEDPFLVVGYVTEDQVGQIDIGRAATATLIDGERAEGRLRFISKRADPSTRMFKVELEVSNAGRTMRDGMTAEIKIPLDPVRAHKVAPSALVLDDDGNIGIRSVNDDEVVTFTPAVVVKDTPQGVWLAGLPDRVVIITVGQQYVSEGQSVSVQYETAEPQS